MCHEIFDLHFCSWFEPIWDPDKQSKVFSNSVSISQRYSFTKLEKFDSAVCMAPRSQNFRLSKSYTISSNLFFMIDVFTPKRISPDCPFKNNQRLTENLILTLGCAVWLRSVMHTAELDSALWCTPLSFFRNFDHLTPRCDAHCEAWLCGGSQNSSNMSVLCVFVFVTPFD